METKDFPIEIKAADESAGTFEALVSAFGNVDLVGDRVLPGAFKKTLAAWRKSGDPIPVVVSHNWDDPMAHVGWADPRAVVEEKAGLLVQGKLDIADNAVARQVYKLMVARRLKAFSFGYTVPEGGEARAEDGANDLSEISLIEVGPTLKGANPEAQLQAVKSMLPDEDGGPALETPEAPQPEPEEQPEEKPEGEPTDPLPPEEEDPKKDDPAIEDAPGEEPPEAKPTAQDPLRREGEALAAEVRSNGLTVTGVDLPPPPPPPPTPEPQFEVPELRQRCREQMLTLLVD